MEVIKETCSLQRLEMASDCLVKQDQDDKICYDKLPVCYLMICSYLQHRSHVKSFVLGTSPIQEPTKRTRLNLLS